MVYVGFTEKWKKIVIKEKYETNYSVSTLGKVRNDSTGKLVKTIKQRKYDVAYIRYTNKKGERKTYGTAVSRLVAIAFIPIPEKYLEEGLTYKDLEADHIREGEDDKNDNSIYNIQWLTKEDNINKAHYAGLYNIDYLKGSKQPDWDWMVGSKNSNSSHKEKEIRKMCKDLAKGELTMKEIAKKYNVKYGFICDLKSGKSWRHITKDYDFSNCATQVNKTTSRTDEDRKLLDSLIKRGATNKQIFTALNLSTEKDLQWVSGRRRRLGIQVSNRTTYSKEFIDQLHQLMREGKSNAEIKSILNLDSSQKTYNLFSIHRKIVNDENKNS